MRRRREKEQERGAGERRRRGKEEKGKVIILTQSSILFERENGGEVRDKERQKESERHGEIEKQRDTKSSILRTGSQELTWR